LLCPPDNTREDGVRKASGPTTSTEPDEPPRDRHGHNRGLQPPPLFDFDALAGGTLLSELETAAVLRISSNTLATWRTQSAHALRWLTLPNGFIRYRVAAIRAYLAMGAPRKRKPKAPATTKIHTEDTAPPRRRVRRAKADALAAPQEWAQ
jgi:hypothetical protein